MSRPRPFRPVDLLLVPPKQVQSASASLRSSKSSSKTSVQSSRSVVEVGIGPVVARARERQAVEMSSIEFSR